MSHSSNGPFSLGDWTVAPSLHRITRDGITSVVEPRVMQVLVCLAEQPGELVTREALMNTVWADTYVSEVTLTRCISELRKAFDDDPQSPQVIETIRKQGYRLIAPVSYGPGATPPAGTPPLREALAEARSWSRPLGVGLTILLLLVLAGLVAGQWTFRPGTATGEAHPPQPLSYAVPFTSYPGRELHPAMVPHGDQVVFAWSGPEGDNIDLYLKQVNTETLVRLTDHPGVEASPAWSVDGKEIAFVRHDAASGCGLFTVSALGGQPRKLTECDAPEIPGLSWSPNGRWIVYADRRTPQEPYHLTLLSLSTHEKQRLTDPPRPYRGDRDPVFSRGGGALVFTRSRLEGMDDLYLIPIAGGEPMRLTHDNRPIEGASWTQTGRAVVFSSSRRGLFSLWHLPLDTTDAGVWAPAGITHQVTALRAEYAVRPTIARASYGLAFEQRRMDTDIWQYDLSPATTARTPPQPIIASTQEEAYPRFSPDGRRIAFVSSRSGYPEVWICDRDGTNPAPVTAFGDSLASEGASLIGQPRWSPDGRRLVFEALVDAHTRVYLAGVERAGVQALTPEGIDALAPSWSHDGQWIYFGAVRGDGWEVWRLSAAGGAMQPVTRQGGLVAREAPDGSALYYTKRGIPGLWRMPPDGGEETRVLSTLAPEDGRNWTLMGTGLFFIDRSTPPHPELVYYDIETQAMRRMARLGQVPEASGLTFSPDGSTLLYTRRVLDESDIMLIRDYYD